MVLAPPRPTNASLLESFAEDATLRGLTKETLRVYRSYNRILGDFLESRGLAFTDIDGGPLKEVLRFVVDRRVKAKTVRAYFSALSADDIDRAIVRDVVARMKSGNVVVGQGYKNLGPVTVGGFSISYNGRYLAFKEFAVSTYYRT